MTLYRHSGRVPFSGLIICGIVFSTLAVFGGAIYSAAIVYLPFVKLKLVITLVFGCVVGSIVGSICGFAKLRNRFMVMAMAMLTMLLFYYVAWGTHAFWLVARLEGMDMAVKDVGVSGILPHNVLSWSDHLFRNGLWSMNAAGDPIKGWFLVALWTVEAVTLFYTTWALAGSTYSSKPFCESCNQWTDLNIGVAELPVAADDPAWSEIAQGRLETLRKLKLATDIPTYVRVDLAQCSSCEQCDHMLASGITMVVDNEGNLSPVETPIVEYLAVTRKQSDEINEFAKEMQEAMEMIAQEEDNFDDADPEESDS